jgi:hypothetical protein
MVIPREDIPFEGKLTKTKSLSIFDILSLRAEVECVSQSENVVLLIFDLSLTEFSS